MLTVRRAGAKGMVYCAPGRALVSTGALLHDTYRLDRQIGEGGMGAVFEASHLRLERRFAIKVLIPGSHDSPEALRRFEREARITSALGHPHIVEVVDFNSLPGGPAYLVMELLEGESLARRLQRVGRLTLREATSILRQASSALHAAHLHGVVHRDIKPANIYLCRRGALNTYVKILDFGVSKVLGSGTVATRGPRLIGSPRYMAPEQIGDGSDQIDARADIYSLGTVVFEMLAGSHPFSASSIPALLFKIANDAPPRLRLLRPELPTGIDEVIDQALRKDPEQRHASMEAFWRGFAEVARTGVSFEEKTEVGHTAWPDAAETHGAEAATRTAVDLPSPPASFEAIDVVDDPPRYRSRVMGPTVISILLLSTAAAALFLGSGRRHEPRHDAPDAAAAATAPDLGRHEQPRPRPDRDQPVDIAPADLCGPDTARRRSRLNRPRPALQAELHVGTTRGGLPAVSDVFLDGAHRGQSPLTVTTTPGTHILVVVNRQQPRRPRTLQRQITLRPGKNRVSLSLE